MCGGFDNAVAPMKVLIIDDHPIVVQGCRRLLEDMDVKDIVVASSLTEGFRLYRQKRPDLIIVDLSMQSGSLSGLNFIRRLRVHDKATPMMVLSMHADRSVVRRALELGANAYVLKDTAPEEFVAAFQKVRTGDRYLSYDLAAEIAFERASGASNPLDTLSLRELQTLSLIAEGRSYAEIADELHVSYKTVVNTVAMLKRNFSVGSLSQLMRVAVELVPPTMARR
jgi:DNA-binding NarL/FixJ family response regulator